MNICIYGSASDLIDEKYKTAVFELGKELARRGHRLIFGGGANGLMGAAARGFSECGGEIVGIIPKFFGNENIEATYSKCTEVVLTDEMYERKRLLEERADAFVITPGGIGTFDEFFAVLTNKQLGRHNKPIAMFNIAGYYDPMQTLMEGAIKQNFVKKNCAKIYSCFTGNQIPEMIAYLESKEVERQTDLKDG